MLKQPSDALVSMVATIEAYDLKLEQERIEHGAGLPTSADGSDGETQTDVGGGKIEAAALVRVGLGGAPSSRPHTPERTVSHGLLKWAEILSPGQAVGCSPSLAASLDAEAARR